MTAKRMLTAVVLIPLIVAAVWWSPVWVVGPIVAVVALAAMSEYFVICRKAGLEGFSVWSLICATGIVAAQTLIHPAAPGVANAEFRFILLGWNAQLSIEFVLVVFLLGCAVIASVSGNKVQQSLAGLLVSSGGLILIALPLSYLVRLHGLFDVGRIWVLLVLAIIWTGDSAAYFVGRAFGRNKLAPEISPAKTWEGAIANLFASAGVAALFAQWLPVPAIQLVGCGLLLSLAGQVGDLMESAVKRAAGVKDSGTILPGHGGMWDRIDALICAAPVAWAYLTFVIQPLSG